MGSKIFLTGATGYIGGTVLDTLVKRHPEYDITVLLRNVPENFVEHYPKVQIVKGDFGNEKLISETASQNNIVIHGGKSKHMPSLKAHIAGLLRRSGPSFLIRLAGTGIIADWKDGPYGELNPKVWSDIDDIDTITTLPDENIHRPIDKIIQAAAADHGEKLKCAIICPPGIYGPGKGLVRTQSLYMPEFCENIIEQGASFYTQSGSNRRSWVHIDDLMKIYLALVEAAVAGGGNAVWGKEGYYFAGSQEASQLNMAKAAGKILHAHGLIKTEQPKQLSIETVRNMRGGSSWEPMGLYTWACNTRTRSDRAMKFLDYSPNAPSLWDTMEADLLGALEECRVHGPTYCPELRL